MQAVRQVVFTDVQIVVRLDVDGQSFAPIGLHKIDATSDWLLTKRLAGVQIQNLSDNISNRRDFSINRREYVICQLKIRGASEKFKHQPRPLLRPSSVNFCPHF
jgi:hypothetical protein